MLGVDIDGDSIIVVEVKETSAGPVIFGYGIAELPPEVASDKDAVSHFLQRLLISRELQSVDAVITLESKDAFVKHLAIPQMPKADMENSVWWETERTSPFPLKEAYFDYHTIKEVTYEDGSRKVDVLVAAAKKDALTERVDALVKANLKPVGVTARALAIVSAFSEKVKSEASSTLAIVDIGRVYTTLVVLEDGHLAFVRETKIGDYDFTEAIRSELGVSLDTAELLKRKYGIALKEEEQRLLSIAVHEELEQIKDTLAFWEDLKTAAEAGALPIADKHAKEPNEAQQVAVAVRYPVERLVGELSRSLGFYRQQNPERKVQEIILCGRGAMLRDVDRLLSARLAFPVKVVNPLEGIRVGSPGVRQEELQSIGTMLTAAFGMARKQSFRYINLLPGGLTLSKKVTTKTASPVQIASLFLASFLSLVVALFLVKYSYATDRDVLQERVASFSKILSRASQVTTQVEKIKQQMEVIENAWLSNPDWFDALRALSNVIIEGKVWLRSLSFEAVRDSNGLPFEYLMKIEGCAKDASLVTEFTMRMAEIEHFQKVQPGGIKTVEVAEKYAKEEVVLFTVNAKLRSSQWRKKAESKK
ncbi:MAG: type IV pilus assembly protein PilM [Planctomycetota bacterium]|nr:type IV pilus assembly protein PilM [Planctomycetota bacterium]